MPTGNRSSQHNLTRKRLGEFAFACPEGAQIEGLEVFIDFYVKREHQKDRRLLLLQMQQFLWSRLYPWKAPGIQLGARSSKTPDRATMLIPREAASDGGSVSRTMERSIPIDETAYFGHRDAEYANPALDNFGFVRAYRKATDKKLDIEPNRHRVRVEVSLNAAGCRYFGLMKLADIESFSFRRLRKYFWMAEPVAVYDSKPKTLRRHPVLSQAVASVGGMNKGRWRPMAYMSAF